MTRRDHPARFKPRAIPHSLWGLCLLLVAVAALILPGSQRLLAGWGDPAAEATADYGSRIEFSNGSQPSTAPRQETSPATSAPSNRAVTVQDPNAYIHTVRLGEYWIGIAQHFGLEYAELRAANPDLWQLRKDVIHPGDQMVIPNLSADQMTAPIAYEVSYGDSWYKIADKFGVSYWDLRLDNLQLWKRRGIYIRPGDELVVRGVDVNRIVAQPEARTGELAVEEPAAEEASPPAEATESSAQTPAQPAPAPGSSLPPSSAPPPILAPEPPAESSVYTVRPGDSWFSVAAAYGISFQDLRAANQELWAARGQSLRVGDQLVIPPHGSPAPPPEIRLVPMTPEETPAAEEGAEEDADEATDEGADEGTDEGTDQGAEEGVDESAEEGAEEGVAESAEEGADEGLELTPVQPEDGVTPDPQPTEELDEERTGPMQAETPEAGRLRIDLAEPTIIYVVLAGEDWASVAAKTGTTVEALQAANPALGARPLQAGDQLRLP